MSGGPPDNADLILLGQIWRGTMTPTPAQIQLADVDRSSGSTEPTYYDELRLTQYLGDYSVPLLCPGAP